MKTNLLPDVSIVIPAYDEEKTIERLLSELSDQTVFPGEVVIVDAGSTDRTVELAEAFCPPFSLRVLKRGRLNPGEARNEGIRDTTATWIALLDAGTEPVPGWLEGLMTVATENGADAVFGSVEATCDTAFRKWAAIAYVPPLDSNGVRMFLAASVFRRSVFEAVGGFPPQRASEDLVWMEKVHAGPFRIGHAPTAVVRWETQPSIRSTFRRFAVYSKANLVAGRGRFWHWGVARLYLGLFALLITMVLVGWGAWAWVLAPMFYLARSLKSAWQKRGSLPFEPLNPIHLTGASIVLVVLDVATLTGTLSWLVDR